MSGSKNNILVIDDEPESLRLLAGILAEEGYRVRPADSGELTLASIAAELPDLILLDIRMRGMSGFEVCRRIKACEAWRQIPLMFISAATEVEERVEGLALGAVDFISKPFRREELLARIRTHLELGRLRSQLAVQVAQQTADLRAAVEQLQLEVAERHRTEIALRESAERFRLIFSQAAVGIAQTSPDAKWLLLNDRFCEILGYTQAELRGKMFLDFTHPDDRDASRTAFRRLLAGEISSWSTEKRYVHKNGAAVWVRLCTSMVRDQDNRPQHFISVVEDVTERVQVERALRDSEQRLMLAKRAAHMGIWERDLRTNVKTISGEYARLYGLAPDRSVLNYEEWLSLIHPDDREGLETHIQASIDRTGSWDTEFRVVWPDGSIHWILTKGTVFLGDSGQPVRRAGVNLDITERKQGEEVRSHLAAIVESSDDAIIGQSLEGAIVSWNPGAERMYGYKAVEMVGRPVSLLVPSDRPDEVPQILERLRRGERLEHCETTHVRKDGCRIFVSVTFSPISNGTGEIVGASVIARDITEQKRAEAALRESEERFRNMADTAPVMIWVSDPDKLVTFFNKGWLNFTGRTMEQQLGSGWTASVHPEELERCYETYSSAFDARRIYQMEHRLRRADGEYRWVLCTGIPRFETDGVFAGYIGSCIDITDQKRAEAMLRQSLDEIAHLNRVAAMGELTASIAHELNQPLAAILLNAQAASRFLNRESPDLARVHRCLADIAADDERAGGVINRLRRLLKKGEFQTSLVDLNEVVSDALRLVRNDSLLRQVTVKFEPSPGLPPVLGDRIQLYQVVLNLIVNGLEAAEEGPSGGRWVLVQAGTFDSCVELTVEDSGKGISETDLTHVFEPFFSTKPEGLGMGLSISQTLVQAHGGRIWAENSAKGGAVFRCVLPVTQHTAVAAAG